MRASDLIGSKVYGADGQALGRVFDIEGRVRDPVRGESEGRIQVLRLVVGPLGFLMRLGYKRRDLQGPMGLRAVASRVGGYYVPWEQLAKLEKSRIRLKCSGRDLDRF